MDAVIGHLGDVLRDLGVGEGEIVEAAALAKSVRGEVLGPLGSRALR